jgi:hypothetical protein
VACWFTAAIWTSEAHNYVLVGAGGVSSYEVLVAGKAADLGQQCVLILMKN